MFCSVCIVSVVVPIKPTPSIVTKLVLINENTEAPFPSTTTFLFTAGFIVTLALGPAPGIGPTNLKPKESVGAVYKVFVSSKITAQATPSALNFLNAESIVGKLPPVPTVYVPAANGGPKGVCTFSGKLIEPPFLNAPIS